MLSGYFGGPVDRALVLLMDTVYSLPVVLAVVMAFLLGQVLNAAAACALSMCRSTSAWCTKRRR